MTVIGGTPALLMERRAFLLGALGAVTISAASSPRAQEVRYRVAFANWNDDPGVRLEGLGFTGADVRRSFELAARTLPIDMSYYDNGGDGAKAIANAEDAARQKIDLFIAYSADPLANTELGRKLREASVPALAINYPVPAAPLYTADNYAAGRLAAAALGEFAKQSWPDEKVVAVLAGDLGDTGSAVVERVRGITEGLREQVPTAAVSRLDTSGNPARIEGLISKFLRSEPKSRLLIAALDDSTAVSAKRSIEISGRLSDCVIVSQGVDRTIRGAASDKREIDPNNRSSIVLGSVAYFMDRYGYEVLPLALRILRGDKVPARTTTKHVLVTHRNVFAIYPPSDMN